MAWSSRTCWWPNGAGTSGSWSRTLWRIANWFGFGHDAKFAGGVKLIKNGDAGFADTVVFELGANVGW